MSLQIERVSHKHVSQHPFTIYTLPISGPKFPTQLGFLELMYDALTMDGFNGYLSYSPDIVFASSGGNVAAYVALASEWNSQGIHSLAGELDSEMFVSSWCHLYPSWVMLPWTGSLYRPGYGADNFFRSIFTRRTVLRTEVWTGTYNKTKQKAQMFCNKREENSLLKCINPHNLEMFKCLPHKYLDGDLSEIASVSLASASIPILTQGVEMGENKYLDGGVMYASPLTVFPEEVVNRVRESGKSLRLVYFSPWSPDGGGSVLPISGELMSIMNASVIQDQQTTMSILHSLSHSEINHKFYPLINRADLYNILHETKHLHTVIILSPHHNISIPMFNPTPMEIREAVSEAKGFCDACVYTCKNIHYINE